MRHKAIGIDLGTSNSCVAVLEAGAPVVIPNRGGFATTPSVFAISETGRRLVGHIARRQALTNPRNTAYAVKRLIGRAWGSPQVETLRARMPYTLVEGPHQDVRVQMREQTFSTSEIAAFVLQEMKLIAEQYLGHDVEQAVITVPAYFNDNQRQATRDAGRIAGLEVLRIINETTAAALAYGLQHDLHRRVAVFDLGGGTFDISVMEMAGGVLEVQATAGDTFLGGEDFDQKIIDWLCGNFLRDHKVDLHGDLLAMQRLKDSVEQAKIELSTATEAEINLPFITSVGANQPLHLQRVLTRSKLEELTADLIDRMIELCRQALGDAGIEKEEIEEVVLVGGMTRMPRLRERVTEFFRRPPCEGVNPDEAVAIGAAIQGAKLVEETTDMVLLDVTPHSLGIMVAGGYFHKLIERNTTVPTSKSHVFTTVRNDQTSVKILVFQGEAAKATENDLLGEFVLEGLRKAPKGEVEVEVNFAISADGIVSVSATDQETGQEQSISLVAASGLTEEEISRMAGENRDFMVALKNEPEQEAASHDFQKLVAEAESLLPRVAKILAGTPFEKESIGAFQAVLGEARAALEKRDAAEVARVAGSLSRTVSMFRGLVESQEHDDDEPAEEVG